MEDKTSGVNEKQNIIDKIPSESQTSNNTPSAKNKDKKNEKNKKGIKIIIISSSIILIIISILVALIFTGVLELESITDIVQKNKQCEYMGEVYEDGDTFPAEDGCNTCNCNGDTGVVYCTEIDCDTGDMGNVDDVDDINNDYAVDTVDWLEYQLEDPQLSFKYPEGYGVEENLRNDENYLDLRISSMSAPLELHIYQSAGGPGSSTLMEIDTPDSTMSIGEFLGKDIVRIQNGGSYKYVSNVYKCAECKDSPEYNPYCSCQDIDNYVMAPFFNLLDVIWNNPENGQTYITIEIDGYLTPEDRNIYEAILLSFEESEDITSDWITYELDNPKISFRHPEGLSVTENSTDEDTFVTLSISGAREALNIQFFYGAGGPGVGGLSEIESPDSVRLIGEFLGNDVYEIKTGEFYKFPSYAEKCQDCDDDLEQICQCQSLDNYVYNSIFQIPLEWEGVGQKETYITTELRWTLSENNREIYENILFSFEKI